MFTLLALAPAYASIQGYLHLTTLFALLALSSLPLTGPSTRALAHQPGSLLRAVNLEGKLASNGRGILGKVESRSKPAAHAMELPSPFVPGCFFHQISSRSGKVLCSFHIFSFTDIIFARRVAAHILLAAHTRAFQIHDITLAGSSSIFHLIAS